MTNSHHAHPMLEPLNYDIDPETASSFLEGNHLKVYELLWRASIATHLDGPVIRAHQLRMAVGEKASLCVKWQELLEPGWRHLISTYLVDECIENSLFLNYEDMPSVVPQYDKRCLFSHSQIQHIKFPVSKEADIAVQVKAAPQKCLTYASLLDNMVLHKVARPSTYANALSSVIKNGLLLKEGNALFLAANGEAIHEKVSSLPTREQLDCRFSYDVETAIEEIEKTPHEAGNLLNQFCQQLFNCDTGLAKWIDDLEIDGKILVSTSENNVTEEKEKREIEKLEEAEASPLDYIIDKVQNFSKINWHEHAWDDYSFVSHLLDKSFSGRLKTREANRLDTSQEKIFEEHLKDFVSIVHMGLCSSIPMMDMLKSAEFYVLTDRNRGFGYLETLKLTYYKNRCGLGFEEIKEALINGLCDAQFYCVRLNFDADCFLEVKFEG